jgi:hypothetical protein
LDRELPLRGRLIWLTSEQGGRLGGPPATPLDQDYAATAFVPPGGVNEIASFIIRADDRAAWATSASADWLVPEASPDVVAGDLLVVTEGPRPVAVFHVESVTS